MKTNSRFAKLMVSATTLFVFAFTGFGCADSAPEFKGDAAWRYLKAQCAFGPRVPATPSHRDAMRFIVEHLKKNGAQVALQRFSVDDPYGSGELQLTNITASFQPDALVRVMLAAHYDTRPRADQEKVDSLRLQPIIGANDGASGVAVLMEISDLLAEHTPSDIGVDLVFFDGEDYGKEGELEYYLLGSKYFASNLKGYRPRCCILLDMVGAEGAQIPMEANSLQNAPELTRQLFARARELELNVFVQRTSQPIYDDHIPLLQVGIPAVDLIGLPYDHWHTLDDTPDKCSPETLRQVGALIADFIYRFSL